MLKFIKRSFSIVKSKLKGIWNTQILKIMQETGNQWSWPPDMINDFFYDKLKGSTLSILKLKFMIKKEVCTQTVSNALEESGYSGESTWKKYFVYEINGKKRLAFIKKYINEPLDL